MKAFLKKYFTFNKGDRNAFLILLFVLLIVMALPFFYTLFYREKLYDFSEFRNEILAFELDQNRQRIEDSLRKSQPKEDFNFLYIDNAVEKSKLNPFKFNPNNLPSEQWKKMGLTDRQVNGIKNYEAKGGRFYIKSDFKKLYVISEAEYETLEPYIDLPEERIMGKFQNKNADTIVMLELNNADSIALKTLKGIGNVISKRIVRYRNSLGGFCKKEQLLEVEGIDTSLFKTIAPYFTLEKRLIRTINVNEANLIDFKGHPYISNNVALSIINYRNMHGPYKTLPDIMKSALVTDELYYRIAPYLSIQ